MDLLLELPFYYSILDIEFILLIGSLLFFISMLVGKMGNRFGIPVLLLFIGVGMFFGQEQFGLNIKSVKPVQDIGTIALCIILFSGGLDTKLKEIRPVMKPGIVLSTFGVIITAFLTGIFSWVLCKEIIPSVSVGFATALLLGATASSTDSASVFGILRSKGFELKYNLRPLLELESGSNDPMAYMMTVTLIGVIQTGTSISAGAVAFDILVQLGIGTLGGILLGKLSVWVINKIKLDNPSLYPILLLTAGIFTFAMTNSFKGNGYLAVYLAGLIIGNNRIIHKRTSMIFIDGLAWFSQILLFLTLGLLVNINELLSLLIPGLIISLFMIFVARPITVFTCLVFFRKITNRQKIYISWVGLRGAAPILFAIYPLTADVPYANFIFNIVFIITLVSLLLQGSLLSHVAVWLGIGYQSDKAQKLKEFDVDFSDDIKSAMSEISITEDLLKYGKNLLEMPLPDKTLVVMVKRGNNYFIPTAKTELHVDDILLLISDDETALRETYESMGINKKKSSPED